MQQLIITILSIILSALMMVATAVYAPSSKALTEQTYQQVQSGFLTLESAYLQYASANNGATPAVASTTDGGLSTNFNDFLPFVPAAPQGYQWKYGYNSSNSLNYFCLYSNNTGAATSAFLSAFTKLQPLFSASQYVISSGGAQNCGSTTSISTANNPTNVTLTYFVRNTQNFNPSAIPGLVVWLDADDLSSLVLNGSTVSQWLDKSGNSNNASQGTASYQPTFNSIGFRGRGGLSFSRSAYDYMEIPLSSSLPSGEIDTFVAGALTTNGAQSTFLSENTQATCSAACYTWTLRQADLGSTYPVDNGIQFATANGATAAYLEPAAATSALNLPAVWEGSYSTSSGTMLVAQNTVSNQSTASNALAAPAYNLEIGRGPSGVQSQYLDGQVGEVLIYNRQLTSAERQRVQRYLGRKWSIASMMN